MIALDGTSKENRDNFALAQAQYEWRESLKELEIAISKNIEGAIEVRQKIIRIMSELRK